MSVKTLFVFGAAVAAAIFTVLRRDRGDDVWKTATAAPDLR